MSSEKRNDTTEWQLVEIKSYETNDDERFEDRGTSLFGKFSIQKGQPHLPETYLIKFSRFLQYLCKIL